MEILWKGDKCTNFGSRHGVKPMVISNHISAGTMQSMFYTFTNPKNQSSSHYGIGRDGSIWQFVRTEDMAWTQGLSQADIPLATAPVVKDWGCDPNYYCISIEHEGYIDKDTGENMGLDGNLTEAQFKASCWLHRFLMQEIIDKFGIKMGLGGYNVIGHYQINPKYRPNCPGPNFPWHRLYAELAVAETMSLEDYERRLLATPESNWDEEIKKVQAVNGELNFLVQLMQAGDKDLNAKWAMSEYVAIHDFMDSRYLIAKDKPTS